MIRQAQRRVVRNSAWNVARGVISFPLSLVLTVVVFRHLGPAEFGIWSLLFVLAQSAILFDFGLAGSLVKFVAELWRKRDYHRMNQLLSTTLAAYGALFVVLLAGVHFLGPWTVQALFKADSSNQTQLMEAVRLACLVFGCQLALSVILSFLQGLQRMDLSNGLMLVVQLAHFALTLLFVSFHHGLWMLVAAHGLAVALGLVVGFAAAKRVCPEMRVGADLVSADAMRSQLPLGLAVQGLSIQTILFVQYDKFALSAMFGPAYAGFYDLAARPLNSLRSLPLALVQPVLPAVSGVYAREGVRGIRELFLFTSKFVSLLAAPVFVAIIVFAEPLLLLWFGKRVPESLDLISFNLRVLAIAYLINVLGSVVSYMAVGIGDRRIITVYSALSTAVHLVATPALAQFAGPRGAPLGLLLATFISNLTLLAFFLRSVGVAPGAGARVALFPVGLAALVVGGAYGLASAFPALKIAPGILVLGAVSASLYFYLAWRAGILDPRDLWPGKGGDPRPRSGKGMTLSECPKPEPDSVGR